MTALPALRPVEMAPVEQDGQPYICLYDPAGYVDDQIVLSPHAFFVAASLDGHRDIQGVQRAFAQQFRGAMVDGGQVREIVAYLDDHGFLQSPRFDSIRERVVQTYRDAPVRPAYFAGRSYPADPDALRAEIDGYFFLEGGPGAGIDPAAAGDGHAPCMVIPHIDFGRGGHVYAHGYKQLHARGKPDTVIVFGVAHQGAPHPFVLTDKDFETPFGVVRVDREIIAAIAAAAEWDPFGCEILHRTEHSVEFHAVMLSYLYGSNVKIVPVLCAQFDDDPHVTNPDNLARVTRFLDACRAAAHDSNKRVAVIASADLAHVGKRFGDSFDIDEAVIQRVAKRDEQDLAHVIDPAPAAFYKSVMRDRNKRNVCGLGCIYAALKTVEGRVDSGNLLAYDYAHDPAGGIVSFVSIELV